MMGLFEKLRRPDINQGLEEFKATPGALLLDVRSRSEYAGGHIPGSRNLPLKELEGVEEIAPEKETPVFVYCQSGGRSGQARRELQSMGYTHVRDLGGIHFYSGELKR